MVLRMDSLSGNQLCRDFPNSHNFAAFHNLGISLRQSQRSLQPNCLRHQSSEISSSASEKIPKSCVRWRKQGRQLLRRIWRHCSYRRQVIDLSFEVKYKNRKMYILIIIVIEIRLSRHYNIFTHTTLEKRRKLFRNAFKNINLFTKLFPSQLS